MLLKEKKIDLRILRTRRILVQAMNELLEKQDLQSITVSDIAEQAMINRATFYAHFADKYDLFAYILREFFTEVLEAEVSDSAEFNRKNLEKLALNVNSAVAHFQRKCTPGPSDQVKPMIEAQLQQQLYEFVAGWIANMRPDWLNKDPEIAAAIISWTLFGTAMQRSQDFSHLPAELLARQTAAILIQGLESIPLPA